MTEYAAIDEPRAVYQREHVERLIACRMLGGLLAALAVLSLLAPAKATLYQILVFVPAALWLFWRGSEKLPSFRGSEAPRPTHVAVLGIYASAALVVCWLSFGTWHATPTRDFGGFERGAGWYTLVFSVLLGLVVAALRQPTLMQPFDTALHVAALACGTIFIGAAVSGTSSNGMSPLRSAVFACGLVVSAVSASVLKRRSEDALSHQGQVAAIFGAAGGLMAASSFMSWGAGGFLVNYRPGSSMGGFDGRVTVWSGAAIVALWIVHFLFGRDDEQRWRNSVRATAILGFAGLMAVVASAFGSSHPGRALAAAACAAVLLKAASLGQMQATEPGSTVRQHSVSARMSTFASRGFAGTVAVLGAILAGAGSGHLMTLRGLRTRQELDYDEVMAVLTFGGLGFVLIVAALGSVRGRALSANAASIVLGGLALVLVIASSGDTSKPILIMAGLFTGVAAFGLGAKVWIRERSGPDLVARMRHVLRSKWLFAFAAGAAGYAMMRWLLPIVIPSPDYGSSPTLEEIDALRLRFRWVQAARWGITITGLVMLTVRAHLLRSAALTAVGLVGYVALELSISGQLGTLQSDDAWLVQGALGFVAVVSFALGRGRYSVVALALATAVTNPWVLEAVLHNLVPRDGYRVPVLRDVLYAIPQTVHFAALIVTFFAFPLRPSKPAEPEPEPPEAKPESAAGAEPTNGSVFTF